MQRRCDRNRKRSKRRPIYCPVHGCYLDSVSRKYPLFAAQVEQLQKHNISRKNALMLMSQKSTVSLSGEWIEAFWCKQCQDTTWYHVCKTNNSYQVKIAPDYLWEQVQGVIYPEGNPSVGEFTRRQARMTNYEGVKGFNFTR